MCLALIESGLDIPFAFAPATRQVILFLYYTQLKELDRIKFCQSHVSDTRILVISMHNHHVLVQKSTHTS